MNVANQLVLDILIEGTPLPSAANMISTIALTEGNGAAFPAAKLVFNDTSGILTKKFNLVDGTHITITAGRRSDNIATVTRQYRVFGFHAVDGSQGPAMVVNAIYDAPKYITGNPILNPVLAHVLALNANRLSAD